MTQQTTTDIIASVRPNKGTYRCPIKGCTAPGPYRSTRAFGAHLAKRHNIHSPKTGTHPVKSAKKVLVPKYPRYCPDCGCDIYSVALARAMTERVS